MVVDVLVILFFFGKYGEGGEYIKYGGFNDIQCYLLYF